jgi:ribosomal protein S8
MGIYGYYKYISICRNLENVQTDVYAKIRSSNVTEKRREVLEKEDYINDIMHQFQNKMLTRLEFIEKLAYKNLPVEF